MNERDELAAELDVAEESHSKVQYSTNGAGQGIYRHLIYTEWTVIPEP